MAIIASELKMYLSGGAANADPNLSIGGAISTTAVTTATPNNLFRQLTGAETTSGKTLYRCIYLKNTNASQTLTTVKTWLNSVGSNADTTVTIGLGAAAKNTTETAIADEFTAPASVTFSAPSTKAAGLSIVDLAAGDYVSLWIKYTVAPGTAAFALDTFDIGFGGDTAA